MAEAVLEENSAGMCESQPAVFREEDPMAFRNLVKQCTGLNISTEQSEHFLEIFGEQLSAAVIKAKRAFIEKHFKP